MIRRGVILGAGVLILGLAVGTYHQLFRVSAPLAEVPTFTDDAKPLAAADEFERLAREDPVALIKQCLARYQREVHGGMTATLIKQERIKGKPAPPELPPEEVIHLSVRGDTGDDPDASKVQVRMIWEAGARKSLAGTVAGTLFVEDKGGGKDKIIAWLGFEFGIPLNGSLARDSSRYCMRDAGIYRAMLRTYEAWRSRAANGTLLTEYVDKRLVPEVGNRMCYIIRRNCPTPEVDAFELGGTPDNRPSVMAAESFTSVTIMIDAETWMQVGSRLERMGADGKPILVGSYYFRNVNTSPVFAVDTFIKDGMKKAGAEMKKK